MFDMNRLEIETQRTLARLMPRLEAAFAGEPWGDVWSAYRRRVDEHFPRSSNCWCSSMVTVMTSVFIWRKSCG